MSSLNSLENCIYYYYTDTYIQTIQGLEKDKENEMESIKVTYDNTIKGIEENNTLNSSEKDQEKKIKTNEYKKALLEQHFELNKESIELFSNFLASKQISIKVIKNIIDSNKEKQHWKTEFFGKYVFQVFLIIIAMIGFGVGFIFDNFNTSFYSLADIEVKLNLDADNKDLDADNKKEQGKQQNIDYYSKQFIKYNNMYVKKLIPIICLMIIALLLLSLLGYLFLIRDRKRKFINILNDVYLYDTQQE